MASIQVAFDKGVVERHGHKSVLVFMVEAAAADVAVKEQGKTATHVGFDGGQLLVRFMTQANVMPGLDTLRKISANLRQSIPNASTIAYAGMPVADGLIHVGLKGGPA